jgi:serine/threonine-protein kinase
MASPFHGDVHIPAADVLRQLERILSHEKLAGSPRLSRFLRFVVQSVLAGNTDSLKEYSIGTNVFDRRQDFDPRIDPIVRVQATNLRIKLGEYYSGAGLQDPVVISVPKGGYVAAFARPGQSTSSEDHERVDHTIAVLPFVNMSSDLENEYFSDGLTEEIINNLAAVPELKVVGRTSVFRFKGQQQDLRDLGRQLHAGAILEGSVRKSGQQLRITAQLIDTKTGHHLWSESWQRELGDTFAVQEEIAATVARALLPQLSPQASSRRKPRAQAHDLYMRGRFEQNRLAEGSGNLALALFEQAIEADPLYARAHAGLAGYLHHLALWGVARPHDVMPKAKAAALRALELDDQLADAHITLGSIQCSYDYDWEQGRRSVERALHLDGDLAGSYEALAMYVLVPRGRLSDSVTALQQAIASDPFREIPRFMLVACCSALGDFAAADENHRANPAPTPYASLVMASAYEENGELDRAIAELSKVAAVCPGIYGTSVEFCRMYTKKGWTDKAQAELEVLLELARTRYVPATEVAMAYLGMGNVAQGLAWLETAVEERTVRLWHLPSDIRYRAIRQNPAYRDILHRIGLQPVEVR